MVHERAPPTGCRQHSRNPVRTPVYDDVLGEQGVHERVPDFSKFLLGFILRLRARPFDQPAGDRILRELLGCVVEEIQFWHCAGAPVLVNCKYRLKFPLSDGSVISRNYRSNPPY